MPCHAMRPTIPKKPSMGPATASLPIHTLIKDNIRHLILEAVALRQALRIKIPNTCIIEMAPRTPRSVPGEASVVATSQRGANMAHDSIRVVGIRRRHGDIALELLRAVIARNALRLSSRGRGQHVRLEIEIVQREVDWCAHFARRLAAPGAEALKVHDEKLGRARDRDLFRCFALLVALRALPHFVAREHFLGTVRLEAILDCAFAGAWNLDRDAVKGFVRGRGKVAGRAP